MNRKKSFLITIAMIAALAGRSQNTVITRDGYKYNSDTLQLTNNQIIFRLPESKLLTRRLKSECKSVSFGNGLKISYLNQPSGINYETIYNGTINLVNGNLFTASVLSVTADKVSYSEPEKNDTLLILISDVTEINYTNGVKEQFNSTDVLIKPTPLVSKSDSANDAKENIFIKDTVALKSEVIKPIETPAHETVSSVFYLGANVALANATTTDGGGSFYFDNNRINKFSGGISSFYEFSKHSALNFNLIYAPRGVGFKNDTSDNQLNCSYIDLPVTYQLQFGTKKLKFLGEAGFYFGYLLAAKIHLQSDHYDYEKKIDDQLHNFEFGVSYGLGLKYYLPYGFIFAGWRHDFALSSLNENSDVYDINGSVFYTGTHNKCNTFYAGYAINIFGLKQHKLEQKK